MIMRDIIKILRGKTDLLSGEGISEELIRKAEERLGLKFASDYRAYLSYFGIIAFDGHELTGIYSFLRLDVTEVTIKQRQRNIMDLSNMYVVEEANIDGIVIWQSSEGDIFETAMNSKPIKICESLIEYIEL
jgi:hypothetical protein